jgi:hypothetical protein
MRLGMLQHGLSLEQTAGLGAASLELLSLISLLDMVAPTAAEAIANPGSAVNPVAPEGTMPLDSLLVSESPATRRLLDQVFLTLASRGDDPAGQPFADDVLNDCPNGVLLELFSGRRIIAGV